MGRRLATGKSNRVHAEPKTPLRDEMTSQKLGELYQDLNDFTETKKKIEALIRFKQSLIDLESSEFMKNSEEFKMYKLRALDAIDHLFNECDLPKKDA